MTVGTFSTASSIDDAVAALAAGARPVAGGTDLVVGARSGKSSLPDSIVAIHRVAALHGIELLDDGGLRLGTLASHREIAASADISARFTALADACAIVGSHATRAQGTIGGNVMNASPAMETGGPLICFDASRRCSRRPGLGSWRSPISGPAPAQRRRAADELLTGIHLPAPADGTGSAYLRLEYRRQMEIAVVGATAVVTLSGGHRDGCARRNDRALPHDPAGARGRGCARSAVTAAPTRSQQQRRRCRPLQPRSPTFAARPTTGARWPP